MCVLVNAIRHKKTAPEGAVLVSWQRRLRFVAVVLLAFDGQQIFDGFTGQGGFIGPQWGFKLCCHLLACALEMRRTDKKTAPEGAVLVSWQRRLRFVALVLLAFDGQQIFGGFTGRGGLIDR